MYVLLSELSFYIYRKIYERIGFNVLNIIFSKIFLIFYDKIINFIILFIEIIFIFLCDVEKVINFD